MFPILFSIGTVHVFSFSVFVLFAWSVFSFLFWRKLRSQGVFEQQIFDLMFYSTLVGLVFSRAVFVLTHAPLFVDNMLKIVALWVQPGLSFYGGFLASTLTLLYLGRTYKVRVGMILDVVAVSLPWALVIGKIGSLLDGSEAGKLASIPWAVNIVGSVGARHPVQIYELVALVVLGMILLTLERRAERQKWPYGVVGVWFFLLFTPIFFALEFFKESTLYYAQISANQWVLIALFAEALGAFYVRGGGREKLRPVIAGMKQKIGNAVRKISPRQ